MAQILKRLSDEPAYTVVRVKNRFLSEYEPIDSAGYRDCQILAQLADGWIVEIQIIPREIFNLKSHLASETREVGKGMAILTGHDAYKVSNVLYARFCRLPLFDSMFYLYRDFLRS